jgi:hypothetical protein
MNPTAIEAPYVVLKSYGLVVQVIFPSLVKLTANMEACCADACRIPIVNLFVLGKLILRVILELID